MKNLIYAGVIGVCILVATVVFVKTRGGSTPGLTGGEMIWVKCLKCGEGYEMGLKDYYEQTSAKARANPSPVPVTPPLTCEKCGKDGIVKGYKCENCGEIFREGAVQNDFPDRCPKCKHSAEEARRQSNRAK